MTTQSLQRASLKISLIVHNSVTQIRPDALNSSHSHSPDIHPPTHTQNIIALIMTASHNAGMLQRKLV